MERAANAQAASLPVRDRAGTRLPCGRELFRTTANKTSRTPVASKTRFRSIGSAAPQIPGFPYQSIPYHLYCKSAQLHPEEGKRGVPAEMKSDRQPQIVRPQQRDAEEYAETGRIRHAQGRGPGVEAVQQSEEDADPDDGNPGAIAADEELQRKAPKRDFFARRAAEKQSQSEERGAS